MIRRVCVLILTSVSVSNVGGLAQNSSPEPKCVMEGTVADSLTRQPLPSVHISLIASWGDTLHTITNSEGQFSVTYTVKPVTGNKEASIILRATSVGYIPWTTKRIQFPSKSHIDILMSRQVTELSGAIVEGKIALITTKGDTVIYNASAIHSMEHETAGDVLKKLPGITVIEYGDKKSLSYNGDPIEVIYVNGRLVFGSDVNDAMDYVQATDVNKIYVYDQQYSHARKRRKVMDIFTFSGLTGTVAGEVLLGGGADTQTGLEAQRQPRYSAGGSFNIFATKNILKMKALTSNIDRRTTQIAKISQLNDERYAGYRTNIEVESVYELRLDSVDASMGFNNYLQLIYGYSKKYQRNEQLTDYLYFPSAFWNQRSIADTLQTQNSDNIHRLNIVVIKDFGIKNATHLDFFSGNSFSKSDRRNMYMATSMLDHVMLHATNRSEVLNKRAWSTNNTLHVGHVLEHLHSTRLSIKIDCNLSDNDAGKLQVDTMAWSTSRTFISASGGEPHISLGGNISLSRSLTDHHSMSLSYSPNRVNTRYHRTAINNFTGEMDSSLTARYTNNSVTQDLRAEYEYNTAGNDFSTTGYRFTLRLYPALRSFKMDKSEFFPDEQQYAKRYLDPVFYCDMLLARGMGSFFSLIYSNNPICPSVEMIRPQIDNTNPLYLRAGNPDLRRAMLHTLSFRLNQTLPERSASLEITATAKLTSDAISTRTRFFADEQILPLYGNYIAPAGSTLLMFVNAGRQVAMDISVNYRFLSRVIKSIISVTPLFAFEKTPGYTGEDLNILKIYHSGLKAGLTANFSKKVKAEFASAMYYNYTDNSAREGVRAFINQTDVNLQYAFLSHCYATANYRYYIYKGVTYDDQNQFNYINVALGCRIFKSRMGEVSLSIYDLLNSTRMYQVKVTSEYRQNSAAYYVGRYVMLNFSYRFNKKITN